MSLDGGRLCFKCAKNVFKPSQTLDLDTKPEPPPSNPSKPETSLYSSIKHLGLSVCVGTGFGLPHPWISYEAESLSEFRWVYRVLRNV